MLGGSLLSGPLAGPVGFSGSSTFQDNISSYSSTTTYPSGLEQSPTNARIWTTDITNASVYNFGDNGSNPNNNTITFTMSQSVPTIGWTSIGRLASYNNYTGLFKIWGSTDGSSWTLIATHDHQTGAPSSLALGGNPLSSSWTQVSYPYYKINLTAGARGTYGSFIGITINVGS